MKKIVLLVMLASLILTGCNDHKAALLTKDKWVLVKKKKDFNTYAYKISEANNVFDFTPDKYYYIYKKGVRYKSGKWSWGIQKKSILLFDDDKKTHSYEVRHLDNETLRLVDDKEDLTFYHPDFPTDDPFKSEAYEKDKYDKVPMPDTGTGYKTDGKDLKKFDSIAKRRLRKEYDDMRGITWYYSKYSPRYVNSRNNVYAYIGKPDKGEPYLRLVITYVGDDWLFTKKYIFKIGKLKFDLPENSYGEIKHDNGGGNVWEWLDRGVGFTEYTILDAIRMNMKEKIKMRYVGSEYYHDRYLTKREKQVINDILNAFEYLGGKISE